MKNYTTVKQVKSVVVNTRHWGDSYGNTYFSGELYVNGEEVLTESFTYGYGDHALMIIVDNAIKQGLLPRKKDDGKEVTWCYLDRVCGRKNWSHTDTQVSRKKDM